MVERLRQAAENGNIDALYASIRENPNLLEKMDQIPFVETPLHKAASAGHTHFAIEIMSLKPSFGRKLNPDGFSPVDLALQNGHYQTVRRLVEIDSDLLRVQGRERITPLHYVAEKGYIDLLADFLRACPASIQDLTIRRETAVHVAVRNRRFEAFRVLLEWLQWEGKEEVLKRKDEEDNNVLHIAAYTNQPKVARLLTKKVDVNAMNLEGLTALDLVLGLPSDLRTREIKNILLDNKAKRASSPPDVTKVEHILSFKLPFFERWARFIFRMQRALSVDRRETLVVVAVLIATTTYQAALQPPGGLSQRQASDGYDNGYGYGHGYSYSYASAGAAIVNGFSFLLFSLSNTAAFYASIAMLGVFVIYVPYNFLLTWSLFFLCISYSLAMVLMSPYSFYLLVGYAFLIVVVFVGFVTLARGLHKIGSAIKASRCMATLPRMETV